MSDGPADDLKLLLLTTSYPVVENSVSGVFVKCLAQSLDRYFQVSVLTPGSDEKPKQQLPILTEFRYAPRRWQTLAHAAGGIPVQLKTKPWMIFWLPFFLCSFYCSALRLTKTVDLLHANWAFSGVAAAIAGKLWGVPVVTTLRGADVNEGGNLLSKALLRLAVKYSDRIVTVSDDMYSRLCSMFPQEIAKVSVIHNGVDPKFLSASCSFESVNASNLSPRIIFVGSLIARKNTELLVKAVAALNRSGIKIECTVVGDGAELRSLMLLAASLGVRPFVRFVGQKTPSEIASLLSEHSIYVSCSLHEGRPNSVIEAMAAGCCCLLSDIAGHRELKGDNGNVLLFDHKTADDLVKNIRQLLENPVRGIVSGKAARQYIIDNELTWDGCARKYKKIFEELHFSNRQVEA